MISGFQSGELSVSVEAIDLSNDKRSCKDLPDLPRAVYGSTAFNLNGIPHVCGGYDQREAHDACYKFNKANWTWIEAPSMT